MFGGVKEKKNRAKENTLPASKNIYRSSPRMKDMKEMEENVKNALDECLLSKSNIYQHVRTGFDRSRGSLGKPKISWASTLPSEMAIKLKNEHNKKYGTQPNIV
ncbi:hypothetical protein BYT27DRAFT_7219246 [Phlegmacium glaucopus]|nr:hypothetical protein BYT27DRAFT_7219246 [Phlegmacium glaucopus]